MSKTKQSKWQQDFLPHSIIDGQLVRSSISVFNVPLGRSLSEVIDHPTIRINKALTQDDLEKHKIDLRLLPKKASELLKDLKPLEFLIQDVLVKGMVYTLTAKNNHGKTTLAVTMAAAVTMGTSFANYKAKPGRVLWLSGENTMDTLYKIKLLEEKGLIDTDKINIIDQSFDLKELTPQLIRLMLIDSLDLEDKFDLVVIDSLQAYAGGMDLNGNSNALTYMQEIRRLTAEKATVLILAHPTKSATKDQLQPYGGGSIMNEIDGNFELWLDDEIASLELGKRRQLAIPPINLKLEVLETNLKDADNNKTQTTMFNALDSAQADKVQMAKHALWFKIADLLSMTDQDMSVAFLGEKLFPGEDPQNAKMQAYRLLEKMRKANLVEKSGPAKLTRAGRDWYGN